MFDHLPFDALALTLITLALVAMLA
jgi:hypothetical protein